MASLPPPSSGEDLSPFSRPTSVSASAVDAERYRNLVEQAVDGIFIADDDGVYLEVNASGERLLGLPREKIVGRRVSDFVCAEDRPLLASDWVGLRNGATLTRERRFRRGDGSIFAGEVTARRLPDGCYQGIIRDITARKVAEESLRRSEQHFRLLTAAAFEGICIQNNGIIVDTNDQLAAMFGYAPGELIGRHVLTLIAPESLEQMTDVVQGQREGVFEQVLLRKDGTKFVGESQAKNVLWDDRPLRIVAVRDLRERKEADLARRKSEEKFSKIFRVSPVSIIVSNLATGRIVDVNDAFLRTYDCTRNAVVGRTTLELDLWRDPTERELLVATLGRTGTVRNFRIKGRTVPGRAITVLINSEVIELGGDTCILTMVQDITDQECAEAALRESEEKFSRAFRLGPNPLAISEYASGRYIEVNAGFSQMFGYTPEEALGRTSVELGIWRSDADRAELLRRLEPGGAVHDWEIETVNRRGEPLIYLLNAETMMLGERRCIVLAAQNITDRKRAERKQAEGIAAEMRAREEFTRRLIAGQETERRRIAGELHDSLGQNLLLLKNRARLALNSGTIPADLHWQFENIEELAAQAIAEVRQISRDLHPYQLEQLGLTRALENMIDGASTNTGFPFTHRFEGVDDLFGPEAATHLFRIVQESVNNVLKHAHAQSASILLERDVRHVHLRIEDDGRGFSDGSGGLGLKNIAERVRILRGHLTVDSAAGRGTRIDVVIPFPDADPSVPPAQAENSANRGCSSSP